MKLPTLVSLCVSLYAAVAVTATLRCEVLDADQPGGVAEPGALRTSATEIVMELNVLKWLREQSAAPEDPNLAAVLERVAAARTGSNDVLLPVFLRTLRDVAGADAVGRIYRSFGSGDDAIAAALRSRLAELIRATIDEEDKRLERAGEPHADVVAISDHAIRFRLHRAIDYGILTDPGAAFYHVRGDGSSGTMLAKAVASLRGAGAKNARRSPLAEQIAMECQGPNGEMHVATLAGAGAAAKAGCDKRISFLVDRDSALQWRRDGTFDSIRARLPKTVKLLIASPSDVARLLGIEDSDTPVAMYLADKVPLLRMGRPDSSEAGVDDQTGQAIVSIKFNKADSPVWAAITRRSIQERIAIVVDDRVISAPTVMSEIRGGAITISGARNSAEATVLAGHLRRGALPLDAMIVSLNIVE